MSFARKLGTVKHFRLALFATWCGRTALCSGPVDFGRQRAGPLTQSEKSPAVEVNVSDQGRGSSSRSAGLFERNRRSRSEPPTTHFRTGPAEITTPNDPGRAKPIIAGRTLTNENVLVVCKNYNIARNSRTFYIPFALKS